MNRWAAMAISATLAGYGLLGWTWSIKSAQAQSCTPLEVVDTVDPKMPNEVQKKVSPPGSPLPAGQNFRNNWNTDFAVNNRARRYIAKVVAINGGKYRVAMHFKYPNNTSDKIYEQTLTLKDGKSVTISGAPRTNQTPYQINLLVGGVPVVGNAYRASVSGCN